MSLPHRTMTCNYHRLTLSVLMLVAGLVLVVTAQPPVPRSLFAADLVSASQCTFTTASRCDASTGECQDAIYLF